MKANTVIDYMRGMYKILKKVEEGTFTTIWEGIRKGDSKPICIKKCWDNSPIITNSQRLCREVSILKAMKVKGRSPSLLDVQVSDEDNSLYIVYDRCKGNTEWRTCFDDVKAYEHGLAGIVREVGVLHAKGITHGSLASWNVLSNNLGCIALCDMGNQEVFAEIVSGHRSASDHLSSTAKEHPFFNRYVAPEIIVDKTKLSLSPDPAWDVWALGCMAAEILLHRPLFDDREPFDHLHEICKVLGFPTASDYAKFPDRDRERMRFVYRELYQWRKDANYGALPKTPRLENFFPPGCSKDGIDFVKKCLRYCPSERATVEQLLKHPFLRYKPAHCSYGRLALRGGGNVVREQVGTKVQNLCRSTERTKEGTGAVRKDRMEGGINEGSSSRKDRASKRDSSPASTVDSPAESGREDSPGALEVSPGVSGTTSEKNLSVEAATVGGMVSNGCRQAVSFSDVGIWVTDGGQPAAQPEKYYIGESYDGDDVVDMGMMSEEGVVSEAVSCDPVCTSVAGDGGSTSVSSIPVSTSVSSVPGCTSVSCVPVRTSMSSVPSWLRDSMGGDPRLMAAFEQLSPEECREFMSRFCSKRGKPVELMEQKPDVAGKPTEQRPYVEEKPIEQKPYVAGKPIEKPVPVQPVEESAWRLPRFGVDDHEPRKDGWSIGRGAVSKYGLSTVHECGESDDVDRGVAATQSFPESTIFPVATQSFPESTGFPIPPSFPVSTSFPESTNIPESTSVPVLASFPVSVHFSESNNFPESSSVPALASFPVSRMVARSTKGFVPPKAEVRKPSAGKQSVNRDSGSKFSRFPPIKQSMFKATHGGSNVPKTVTPCTGGSAKPPGNNQVPKTPVSHPKTVFSGKSTIGSNFERVTSRNEVFPIKSLKATVPSLKPAPKLAAAKIQLPKFSEEEKVQQIKPFSTTRGAGKQQSGIPRSHVLQSRSVVTVATPQGNKRNSKQYFVRPLPTIGTVKK